MDSFDSAVAQFNYPPDKYQQLETLRQQFLFRFPESKLANLTLQEYALGLNLKRIASVTGWNSRRTHLVN